MGAVLGVLGGDPCWLSLKPSSYIKTHFHDGEKLRLRKVAYNITHSWESGKPRLAHSDTQKLHSCKR